MSIRHCPLEECPTALREAAEKLLNRESWSWEQLSVTVHESTPYIDKSQILTVHEALLCRDNTFCILSHMDGGAFPSLSESVFTLGTLHRILETAPAWMGLGGPVSTNQA